MDFTEEQVERYSRNILLDDVGGTGQRKLLDSSVLIIGAGGLGSPAALYLAAAGVGTIGIVDDDHVELSNLQRQVIHFTSDISRPKAESAAEKMRLLNPGVTVIPVMERLMAGNIVSVIKDYDFIIDGTDNFPSKFLINDACVLGGKPFSHGGILRFYGQTLTYVPGSACYRCLFQTLPPRGTVPSCGEAGILGVVAGILGMIQASEALRYILGIGELLTNRLLYMDQLTVEFRKLNTKPNPNCPVCGENRTILEPVDYEQPACSLKEGPAAKVNL